MWRSTALTKRLGLQHPILLAPMAGVSTPNLVAAVTNSGGLGMYGAALTPAKDLPGLVESVRSFLDDSNAPFGFNLFCPPAHIPKHTPDQQQALEAVHKAYADLAAQHKLSCDTQMRPAPNVAELHMSFQAQVEALLEARVPVLAFYFGLPEPPLLSKVQQAGVVTMGTATNKQEALQLLAAGIDCIVVQGMEAGGHRGTWYSTPGSYTDSLTGTLTLLGLLQPHVGSTPLIAAGGIMTGQQVLAALAAGAAGVQLGTAFLAADEAGTSQAGRELLLQEPERGTLVTQAFTGKPARGLHNTPSRQLQEVQAQLPTSAYGLVNSRGFYGAAAAAGVKDCCIQLCGQGYPLCRTGAAEDIIRHILAEADEAAQQLCAGS